MMKKYKFKNCEHSYDETCDAIFIFFDKDGEYEVSEDIGTRQTFCVIDVDKKNNPLSIEFLDFSKIIKRDIDDIHKSLVVKEVILEPVIGYTIVTLDIIVNKKEFVVKLFDWSDDDV